MMVINMQIQARTAEDFRKTPDAAGLLTIDDNQSGDGVKIDLPGAGNGRQVVGVTGDKIAHPLFLGTGKRDPRSGVEPGSSSHSPQAVEIGIYVSGDDIHSVLFVGA